MSSAIAPPANSYVSLFDFVLQFDLSDGKIKIDLSPSIISDPSKWPSPTDVTVDIEIKRPDNIVFSAAAAFDGSSINTTWSYNIPKLQSVYMWGQYAVTATVNILNTGAFPVTKSFLLCAPSDKIPSIQVDVDCALGTLTVRGFCGLAYRGVPPTTEVWNMTRYYPPEAELLPQKNLSVIPFVVDAYIGMNTIKGSNTSTYEFDDNIKVIVFYTSTVEKNVRCGIDMESVFCGMQSLYDTLAACKATPEEYNKAFGEINALLWMTTAGLTSNKDMEDEIERLEKLLGIECRCLACKGERVGPVCVPVCPQVANIQAMVTTSTSNVASTLGLHTFTNQGANNFTFLLQGSPLVGDKVSAAGNINGYHITVTSTAVSGWTLNDICQDLKTKIQAAATGSTGQLSIGIATSGNYVGLSVFGENGASMDITVTTVAPTSTTSNTLQITFDSSPLPAGSKIRISYRPYCNPGANPPWTQIADVAATQAQQTVSITVPDAQTYQVMVASVMPDGTVCDEVIVTAPGTCSDIVDVNQPPDPKTLQALAEWGWSLQPFDATSAVAFTDYKGFAFIDKWQPITADFAGAPHNTSYFILRYPPDAPDYKNWHNTPFNYGVAPDQVLVQTFGNTQYKYVWSRVKPVLDSTTQKIIFST